MRFLKRKRQLLSLVLAVVLVFTAGIEWTAFRSEATEWVKVDRNNVVVDSITVNGKTVNAYYRPYDGTNGSDSYYSCAAFVHRFYSDIYGIQVSNLWSTDSIPQASSGYFYSVNTPKVGDIVRLNNKTHWAIVKKLNNDGSFVVIEQNYHWEKEGVHYGAKGHVMSSGDNITLFRWSGSDQTIEDSVMTDDSYFNGISATDITNTDARIGTALNNTYTLTNCGFILGLKSNLSDGITHKETEKYNISGGKRINGIGYNLSEWYGSLQPGTKYYYLLFIVKDGVTIKSSIKSFITAGNPAPELKSIVVETGRPDYYRLRVKLKDNTGVGSVVYPTWTKKNGTDDYVLGKPTTSYTKNNNWIGQVNYADHENEDGQYITDIYAYDTADTSGKGTSLGKFDINVYKLSSYKLNLYTNDSNTLSISPAPNVNISWTSDDESVAKVSAGGKVTAVKSGETVIKGTYKVDGITYEARCNVTVSERVYPSSISLSKTSMSIEKGATASLSVSFNPTNATEKGISWKSSDTKVATVDNNGKVTAVAGGTATITATSSVSGVKAATCKVTVTETLKEISLSASSMTLEKGKTGTLTVSYNPSTTTSSKSITWTSSDSKVATVDKNGIITAVAGGTATITATSAVSGVKAVTCQVTVTETLTKISLSKTAMTLEKGKTGSLTVSYDPSTTTSSKVITWTSSDTKVATVDKNGKVTAVGAGTANITATSAVKEVKAVTCVVTVNDSSAKKDEGKKDSNSSGSDSSKETTDSKSEDSSRNADNSGSPYYISGKNLEWVDAGGKSYWYENGFKQGTYYDEKGVIGDGTVRGREICDMSLEDEAGQKGVWFWLDSVYGGAKAVGKEVWMPYIYQDEAKWTDEEIDRIASESDYGMDGMGRCVRDAIKNKAGKWVRYDANGKMLKGWVPIVGELAKIYPSQAGNTYYYDTRTGLMAKGTVKIDGVDYYFDEITGALQ